MPRLTPEQVRLIEENHELPEQAVRRFFKKHGLRWMESDQTYQDMVADTTEHFCKLSQKWNGLGSFRGFANKRLGWYMIDWLRENGPKRRGGKERPKMSPWDATLDEGTEVTGDNLMREEDRDPGFVDEWGGMEFFKFAVNKLPSERERRILWMRYVEGVTLREIGEMEGVTEGRISQIESAALSKLRKDPDVVQTAAALR